MTQTEIDLITAEICALREEVARLQAALDKYEKAGPKTPLHERQERFLAMCAEVVKDNPTRLCRTERKPFLDYWTETDRRGRMRWEAEKFFDVGRRMDTWMRTAINSGKVSWEEANRP